jgi:hypothetical protein
MNLRRRLVFAFFMWVTAVSAIGQISTPQWPTGGRETKPWTRWWWHGSALTKQGITAELEAYQKAGLGGVEITPIYGVYGEEKRFTNYLTPEWMELLTHTLKEGERLDMGIDMATGTGWPFGGPWVAEADACKNVEYKIYELKSGESIKEKITYIQQPYLRAVGSQVYEVHDTTITNQPAMGTQKEPLTSGRKEININDLVQPVADNKNLQALALDQVKFEREIPLQVLMAYSEDGTVLDLTKNVQDDGMLLWTAPNGNWKLYAIFMGWHGKMVERAGPGGEGNVMDHFSADALKRYLDRFDNAFGGSDIRSLRAFFNDSYEVDDARGNADWTPLLFDEFRMRRGYDLIRELPALFAQDTEEKNQRVLCDYRETVSELVLDNFTRQWKNWAHKHNAVVRNQAHGSPSNILDLYATVDIPEIEGVEPLRIKMATSAGHVSGKKLISCESATWLNEHFESSLADIKAAVDRFLLQGVNHIFYHGTSYSPPAEPWPGWLFYAAVHLNPRNSLWPHFPALNKYVNRVQSIFQNSTIDNDILLYYPIYDRFSTPGKEMIEHFDAVGAQFDGTAFKRAAETMLAQGYPFDFISDMQLQRIRVENGDLVTEGNNRYKTIVVPKCRYIPLSTMRAILNLAKGGATVVFFEGVPSSISGYYNLTANQTALNELIAPLNIQNIQHSNEIKIVMGRAIVGSDLPKLLVKASIQRETMVDSGLQFLRRKSGNNGTFYFVQNGEIAFEGWVTLQSMGKGAVVYEPMTGNIGAGRSRASGDNMIEVWIQLQPRETLIIEVRPDLPKLNVFPYIGRLGTPLPVQGSWQVVFTDGGPQLPASQEITSLKPWTLFSNDDYKSFSGLATYTISFPEPQQKAATWILDLGDVKESAEVILNGKSLGIFIGPVFKTHIAGSLLKKENWLEIKVANLMANRISYMDRQKIFWKKFYNVNFPARKAENRKNGIFDAGDWAPKPSGLLGPVHLIPVTDR